MLKLDRTSRNLVQKSVGLRDELHQLQRHWHERQHEDQQSQHGDGQALRVERRLFVANRRVEEADQEDQAEPDPPALSKEAEPAQNEPER
jgi:hypothetical protein